MQSALVRFERGGQEAEAVYFWGHSKARGRGRAEGDTTLLLEDSVGEGCRPRAREPWF